MLNRGANVARIDARTHLASLAGATLIAPDGTPIRILGVSRDYVYVMTGASPLGGEVPISAVEAAVDRLAAGDEVELSAASLGDDAAFVGAVLLSLPGAEQLDRPQRARLAAR